MIQRIQTLFLLVAAILLTCLFFYPFINFEDMKFMYTDPKAMAMLLLIVTLISYINIFFYRKRMMQIRLCMLNCLLLLALQGFIVYYIFAYSGSGGTFSLTVAFPIIAAILIFLGLRYIARDEAMVRSLDRLR